MDLTDILQPYSKLIDLEIEGEVHSVPENNSLLRCFQFLSIESISLGDFCWNGECLNCQVWIANGEKEKLSSPAVPMSPKACEYSDCRTILTLNSTIRRYAKARSAEPQGTADRSTPDHI